MAGMVDVPEDVQRHILGCLANLADRARASCTLHIGLNTRTSNGYAMGTSLAGHPALPQLRELTLWEVDMEDNFRDLLPITAVVSVAEHAGADDVAFPGSKPPAAASRCSSDLHFVNSLGSEASCGNAGAGPSEPGFLWCFPGQCLQHELTSAMQSGQEGLAYRTSGPTRASPWTTLWTRFRKWLTPTSAASSSRQSKGGKRKVRDDTADGAAEQPWGGLGAAFSELTKHLDQPKGLKKKAATVLQTVEKVVQNWKDLIPNFGGIPEAAANMAMRILSAAACTEDICEVFQELGGPQAVAKCPVKMEKVMTAMAQHDPAQSLVYHLIDKRGVYTSLHNKQLQLFWHLCDWKDHQAMEFNTLCNSLRTKLHLVVPAAGQDFQITPEQEQAFAKLVDVNGDGQASIAELNRLIGEDDCLLTRVCQLMHRPSNKSGRLLSDDIPQLDRSSGHHVEEMAGMIDTVVALTVAAPIANGTTVMCMAIAYMWRAAAPRRLVFTADWLAGDDVAAQQLQAIASDIKTTQEETRTAAEVLVVLDDPSCTAMAGCSQVLNDAIAKLWDIVSTGKLLVASSMGPRAFRHPHLDAGNRNLYFIMPTLAEPKVTGIMLHGVEAHLPSSAVQDVSGWQLQTHGVVKLAIIVNTRLRSGALQPDGYAEATYADGGTWVKTLPLGYVEKVLRTVRERVQHNDDLALLTQLCLLAWTFDIETASKIAAAPISPQKVKAWIDAGLLWEAHDGGRSRQHGNPQYYIPQVIRLTLLDRRAVEAFVPEAEWTAACCRFSEHYMHLVGNRELPAAQLANAKQLQMDDGSIPLAEAQPTWPEGWPTQKTFRKTVHQLCSGEAQLAQLLQSAGHGAHLLTAAIRQAKQRAQAFQMLDEVEQLDARLEKYVAHGNSAPSSMFTPK
ncbi:hypothetical protein WJX72_010247 [[Myrmecia] bisecta]|uniref:EF-hand domain-containing protein n=1 Tax=[Myrmecia] bisecta TaxID=41462 RepID=A0AAW1P3R9_9CHLO